MAESELRCGSPATPTAGEMTPLAVFARLQKSGSRRPLLAIAVSVLAFSTAPVLVQASSTTGPVFAFWRSWLGIVTTIGALAAVGRLDLVWPKGKAWRIPALAGFFNAASTVMFMTAVKFTSVADVSLLTMLNPVLIALWAIPLFGERPGLRFRLWTLVAIVGSSVVVLGGSTGPDGNPIGIAMAALSVVAFSLQFVTLKLGRGTMDTMPLIVAMIVVSAALVSVFCLVTGQDVRAVTRIDLLNVLGVVVLPGGIGAILLTWSLRWVPANVPPLVNLPLPLLAGGMAWLFLGEPVTIAHLGGGTITLVGVAFALMSPSGKAMLTAGHTPPTPPLPPG